MTERLLWILLGLQLLTLVYLGGATIGWGRVTYRMLKRQERLINSMWKRLDLEHAKAHLETMKALKGQSYAGQFGGLDVHTDPALTPGTVYGIRPHKHITPEEERMMKQMAEADLKRMRDDADLKRLRDDQSDH